MGSVIELRKASKHYKMGENIVKAVDGIDIAIEKGDFVAIMGSSGSGKSTSMNLIGSLDVPTFGSVHLDGHNIAELDESQLAGIRGKKIGFIFQSFNLIANLTAKENIMLPMLFQGYKGEEREKRAEYLLKEIGLSDRGEHYPSQLSGGQQQRVAIARALANDPEIILADEPTGNLDTKTGEKVMDFLKNLNKNGKTIILITHDSEIALAHAKKVYTMKDGRVEKAVSRKR